MKDLSTYIESLLFEFIPKSTVRVHLHDGVYNICVNIYEISYAGRHPEFLIDMTSNFIDSEMNKYFPNKLPNYKKIVNVYEEHHRIY